MKRVVLGEGYILFDKAIDFRYWLSMSKKALGLTGVPIGRDVANRELVRFPDLKLSEVGKPPRKVRLVAEVLE
jgi:hypothetical protein